MGRPSSGPRSGRIDRMTGCVSMSRGDGGDSRLRWSLECPLGNLPADERIRQMRYRINQLLNGQLPDHIRCSGVRRLTHRQVGGTEGSPTVAVTTRREAEGRQGNRSRPQAGGGRQPPPRRRPRSSLPRGFVGGHLPEGVEVCGNRCGACSRLVGPQLRAVCPRLSPSTPRLGGPGTWLVGDGPSPLLHLSAGLRRTSCWHERRFGHSQDARGDTFGQGGECWKVGEGIGDGHDREGLFA